MTLDEMESLIAMTVLDQTAKFFNRRLKVEEKKDFADFLCGEGGKSIEFPRDRGTVTLDAVRRGNTLLFRIAFNGHLNGCAYEGKRWTEQTNASLERICKELGRKGLPVRLFVVEVGERGQAIRQLYAVELEQASKTPTHGR